MRGDDGLEEGGPGHGARADGREGVCDDGELEGGVGHGEAVEAVEGPEGVEGGEAVVEEDAEVDGGFGAFLRGRHVGWAGNEACKGLIYAICGADQYPTDGGTPESRRLTDQ